jgi:hypothetical protein
MVFDFARRCNLLTGDNGLGKSFVLDVAWWSLTRTWARRPVVPAPPPVEPSIAYRYTKLTPSPYEKTSHYDRRAESWPTDPGRPAIPGLVLYAQVDGGFSVWDPARNYWRKQGAPRPPAYLFAADAVWDGNDLCEGLVRDWASWQREENGAFQMLRRLLVVLSPGPGELLAPGELRRISLDDPRDHPTLRMPYGQDVPLVHASAGVRRITALAYLLVWAWREHEAACALLGQAPAREVVFLVDEIEAHLHPRWQRAILPALLSVVNELSAGPRVQLLVATHSALVLGSMEDSFDAAADLLYDLELTTRGVEARSLPFAPLGTADEWLVSDAIGLASPRGSRSQEALLGDLSAAWNDPALDAAGYALLSQRLAESSLPETDPTRSRWLALGRRRGFTP